MKRLPSETHLCRWTIDMIVVEFDTETTGLIKNHSLGLKWQPKVIEFYAKKSVLKDPTKKGPEAWEFLEELDFLCHPEETVTDEITRITGITNAMLVDQPHMRHRFPEVVSFFEGVDLVVAHNLSYDKDIIDFENARHNNGQEFIWPPNLLCTVEATVHLKGHRLRLSDLHELLFGVKFEGSHRAKVDVEALERCYVELHRLGEV